MAEWVTLEAGALSVCFLGAGKSLLRAVARIVPPVHRGASAPSLSLEPTARLRFHFSQADHKKSICIRLRGTLLCALAHRAFPAKGDIFHYDRRHKDSAWSLK